MLVCLYRQKLHTIKDDVSLIDHIKIITKNTIFIFAEFNFRDIKWTVTKDSHNESPSGYFTNTTCATALNDYVLHPTPYRDGKSPSILDLIAFSNENAIISMEYLRHIDSSYHVVLLIS